MAQDVCLVRNKQPPVLRQKLMRHVWLQDQVAAALHCDTLPRAHLARHHLLLATRILPGLYNQGSSRSKQSVQINPQVLSHPTLQATEECTAV
jgi:hypothetical protein